MESLRAWVQVSARQETVYWRPPFKSPTGNNADHFQYEQSCVTEVKQGYFRRQN